MNIIFMKTFRRPFWQATTSKWYITFTVIMAILITPFVYFATYSLGVCLLLLLIWSLACFPIYFTQYFYVVLTDDQLILRNSIYTFWHKEYFYKDITKVEIKPSTNIFMKVHLEKPRTFSGTYVIDLVAPVDYDELIDCLRAKSVIVETAGLDIRFPSRNKRKTSVISRENDSVNVFRQSLWNTSLFKTNFILTAIGTTLFAPAIFLTTRSVWLCLGFIFLGYMMFLLYFTRHFYVLLLTDRLILKNGVYSLTRREYLFKDVVKIKIKRDRNIYIQVFTRKDEEKVKLYCIDVVAPKDYKLLVEMLIIKGVVVETEGLEMYLS